MPKAVKTEYKNTVLRAKDIGKSRLLSAYMMAAYFIALNRNTLGNADNYLDIKKMPGRKAWERKSHERKYENDWVVDILGKTDDYELGYDYHECGICKLCQDEGCFELAQYLCRLDFVLADIMGMKLERTKTIATGADFCDFRYSRKQ